MNYTGRSKSKVRGNIIVGIIAAVLLIPICLALLVNFMDFLHFANWAALNWLNLVKILIPVLVVGFIIWSAVDKARTRKLMRQAALAQIKQAQETHP